MSNRDFESRLKDYFDLAKERPELFDNPPGGVQILLDRDKIAEVEASVARDLLRRGLPAEGANVGVVLRDPWFSVIRDAVEFADGSRRMHARVINRLNNGSAVLPVLDGKIILIRHFRHPIRRAILEIPRGAIETGQSPEDAAHMEIREEIGGTIRRLASLGFLYGTTNIFRNGAHLLFAELDSVGAPQIGEGVQSIEQFSVEEFEALLLKGEILDSFTVAAYTHCKLRKLI